ncbi:chromate transporter [Treponema pectinovorum]|uniref:chromate transporter n=1 Tax=Treponema pectinovorum TaxID=164 RepID=UPI003D94980D
MEKKINILWQLFCLLFKVGLFTFGGGIAMLPILERELVEKRGWTTSNELLDWFAIGQSTPGIIAVNVSTFIGYKKAGVIGACVATFAMVLPSIIIITIIAIFINNFAELLWVQKALRGINVAVAAILTNAVYKFAKKSVKDAFGFFLLVLAFVLIFVFKVPTVCVIFGSCVPGLVILLFKEKLLHRKSKKE